MVATGKMTGADRRAQVLAVAAREFAAGGLHGTSAEAIARRAGITQAYVFRLFGTKKRLFIEVVTAAFDRVTDGMSRAADGAAGLDALAAMGSQYDAMLGDETELLLQLQGFAACGDTEVREAVRASFARMWAVIAGRSGLEPVTVKTFLAYGMLLNAAAALALDEVTGPWAAGIRTRIQAGLFAHITGATNQ
jgi:AcrR family transcriptional regulator